MFRADRLSALLNEKGLSQSELARRVGVSQATIWKLTKESKQGSKYLHRIAAELGVSPSYLAGDSDDRTGGLILGPAPALEPTGLAEPTDIVGIRELDLSLGFGATYLDVPVTETTQFFGREFIRQFTRSRAEDLLFCQGVGDSMFPTLLDSDLLLIDCSQKVVNMSDKVWAVSFGGMGMVKRIGAVPGGGVALRADNPAIPDQIAHDGELHILGRVVAYFRKM